MTTQSSQKSWAIVAAGQAGVTDYTDGEIQRFRIKRNPSLFRWTPRATQMSLLLLGACASLASMGGPDAAEPGKVVASVDLPPRDHEPVIPVAAGYEPLTSFDHPYSDGLALHITPAACPGNALVALNSERQQTPASITKVMTLYLVAKAIEEGKIRLDTPITIPQGAIDSARRADLARFRTTLRAGDQQTVRRLAQSVGGVSEGIGSFALPYAVATAYNWGGDNATYEQRIAAFVEQMNQTAAEIGMMNTQYVDPSSTYGNIANAADLSRLHIRFGTDFPQWIEEFMGNETFYTAELSGDGERTPSSRLLTSGDAGDAKTGALGRGEYRLANGAWHQFGPTYNETAMILNDHGQRVYITMLGAPDINKRGSIMRQSFDQIRGIDVRRHCVNPQQIRFTLD